MMELNKELKDKKYKIVYSENKLFEKIKKFGKNAGIKAVYLVLLLYYTLIQSTTPKKAKSIIVGALGYFIFPVDLIPDIIPIAGFSDDITALLSVVVAVALFINDDTKARAKAKLHTWFGNYDDSELIVLDSKIDNQTK